MQKFGQYNREMVIHLLNVYATSFYGSTLWSLASDEFDKLCRAWNTAIRLIWDLPFGTHTRLLETISRVPHLELVLHCRSIGFLSGLADSNKPIVKLIFNAVSSNVSTVTGSNISYLLRKYSFESVMSLAGSKRMIKNMQRSPLTKDELWKIGIIQDVVLSTKNIIELEFDENDLEAILANVSVS